MYCFGVPEILIFLLAILICCIVVCVVRRRITAAEKGKRMCFGSKYGQGTIIAGSVVAILSALYHAKVLVDIVKAPELLRPITGMLSTPLLLLTMVTFMAGVMVFYMGMVLKRRSG